MPDVYQVIFEEQRDDGTITDVIEYVQAKSLKSVALSMDERAIEMDWTLKSVRYTLTVVEAVEEKEND